MLTWVIDGSERQLQRMIHWRRPNALCGLINAICDQTSVIQGLSTAIVVLTLSVIVTPLTPLRSCEIQTETTAKQPPSQCKILRYLRINHHNPSQIQYFLFLAK